MTRRDGRQAEMHTAYDNTDPVIDFTAEDDDDSEADICWINIKACSEILNVDVWVMRNKVSMCLLILHERFDVSKYLSEDD